MQKRVSATHSWRKTQALKDCIQPVWNNWVYHEKLVVNFLQRHNLNMSLTEIVHGDLREEYHLLVESVNKAKYNYDKIKWYITRVLTNALSYSVAKELLPESYWHKIQKIDFTGTWDTPELVDSMCYSLLEEVTLQNLLLGITDNDETGP